MALPSSRPSASASAPHSYLALIGLLLSLLFPIGYILFILRYVIESHYELQPNLVPAVNVLLNGVATLALVLGIPAFSFAIMLGHVVLGQVKDASLGQRARRMARVSLLLGYSSLIALLATIGFMVLWLSTHQMHLVW
jgi:hypothetical protein